MTADMAQYEHSNIKCYALAFNIIQIQIKTILFIFYLWNPDIVTNNTKQNTTKPKKKKKEHNCFTCTKSIKYIPIFQTQTILMVKMQLCIEKL